jgi:hypothetical protein
MWPALAGRRRLPPRRSPAKLLPYGRERNCWLGGAPMWCWRENFAGLRIPLKPAMDSETKPATRSDFIPASVPI